jgi:hypothetical protein
MVSTRRQRFVHAHLAWMLATFLLLTVLGAFSLELLFVASLIGFLVVVELTAPFGVSPRWRRRLVWLILLGLIGFAYTVAQRILEILPGVGF